MPAKPCSSKVERSRSTTCCSTVRWAGSSSGNPLSGVVLAISETSGDPVDRVVDRLVVLELEQERVGGALAADAGLLAVAGQHHDVVAQRQHLLAQAAQHGRVVTAGQVGAADGPGEEQVAAE